MVRDDGKAGKKRGPGPVKGRSDGGRVASGQPSLRERKKQMRLERITSAARELFAEKGFSNTTIQDIAAASDIGLGTLYLYARSKEDLLVLVFKKHILQMIDRSFENTPRDRDLIDQLMIFFEGHIEYHKDNQSLSRAVLKELSFSETEQRKQDINVIMDSTYSRLNDLVQRAITDGRVSKPLYAGTATWSIFALFYHLLQGFLCEFISEEEFKKDLHNALRMLLD